MTLEEIRELAILAKVDITFTSDNQVVLFDSVTEYQTCINNPDMGKIIDYLKAKDKALELSRRLGKWV
jgi:hypothetical protein